MSFDREGGLDGLDLGGGDGGGDDGDDGEEREPVERQELVVFRLGDDRLAVQVDAVRTIVEPGELTEVPRSSEAIDGVMDLRGDLAAVINPRVLFATTAAAPDPAEQRILVFDRGQERQTAGIRVDEVEDVESFPAPLFYSLEETDADHLAAYDDLLAAVIHRLDDGAVTEHLGVVDAEALVQASGTVAAETSR